MEQIIETPWNRAGELPKLLPGQTWGCGRITDIPDAEETRHWEPGTRD